MGTTLNREERRTSPDDQRRFPRVPATTTILVESLDRDGTEEFARTSSLSRGGCGFLSPEPLEEGAALQLLISAGSEVIRARCRVIYSLEVDSGHEVGVEFVQITPEDEQALERLLENPRSGADRP